MGPLPCVDLNGITFSGSLVNYNKPKSVYHFQVFPISIKKKKNIKEKEQKKKRWTLISEMALV